MKAVVVTPGKAGSGRLADVPDPDPGPDGALVECLEVGVCGTDQEILGGEYGEAPDGDDYLVLGHENLGRVLSAPTGAPVAEGDLVVCRVRRPDPVPCPQCAAGESDMCTNGRYTERGIKGRHGFMSERWSELPEYLVKLDPHLADVGVLVEPLTVVEKAVQQAEAIQRRMTWRPQECVVTGAGPIGLMATFLLRSKGFDVYTVDLVDRDSPRAQMVTAVGAEYVKGDEEPLLELAKRVPGLDLIVEATGVPQLVFDAMDAVGPAGVVALTGVSARGRTLEVAADHLNLEMVLDNKVVFGTVNAGAAHYAAAARDLARFEELWPGVTQRVVSRRVPAESFDEALERRPDDVKTTIAFAAAGG